MEKKWDDRKNILCIRLDNIGDLIMSSAAIKALKESYKPKITVLTSSMAAGIARHIPCIDEIIVADVPWVKTERSGGASEYLSLVSEIRQKKFDAAVVFTVFSQNPLPAVMLAYLAGIPYRLAYCRENPYDLLTHWIPDKEPYTLIRHQVERDLALVESVGAIATSPRLSLHVPSVAYADVSEKLTAAGVDLNNRWLIVHPGASEPKRLFPPELFNNILKSIVSQSDYNLVFTGTLKEKLLTEQLRSGIGDRSVSMAGQLSLEEFMALIDIAPLVLSVNTGTVHIAAALNTPVVVLYAQTNPQHTPWNVASDVFPFPVELEMRSRNEVLQYISEHLMEKVEDYPSPEAVTQSVLKLLKSAHQLPA